MKVINCCGECANYNWKKHKCSICTIDDPLKKFYDDCPLKDVKEIKAETIKEFAEKLKKSCCDYDLDNYHSFRAIEDETIDEIAKEMICE